ncbi:MAG: cell division protein FtsA [Chloroflexota bacterium]|nr:cell division protein FtsA [Chloroflexota bacterium]
MEREAVLVAIDVGTSKVVALIGEVTRDGALTIIGKGAPTASGLKKGVVINIDQTVSSIRGAIEGAERLSGYKLESAFVSVGGAHVESQNSRGAVAVSGPRREVGREDVDRATEVARAVTIPSNREVLHVLPRGFVVDGQEGVKDPLGMSAIRLEVETHIVHASATAVQNLTKCVGMANVRIDELVASSLAAAEAVLSDTERELGVAVADIGAGTTDLALFMDGSPLHTAVLPIGGNNVTNDVAIGLKTNLIAAEDMKIRHGTADPSGVSGDEEVTVEVIGEGEDRTAPRSELADIIEARMRELFEKIGQEIERAGHAGRLPAGLVLTGGAAQLAGTAGLGREVLKMPVRVASPGGVGGLTDHLLEPAYSTSIGLLLWGARVVTETEPGRYESAPAGGSLGRFRDWLRGLFP